MRLHSVVRHTSSLRSPLVQYPYDELTIRADIDARVLMSRKVSTAYLFNIQISSYILPTESPLKYTAW